MKKIFDDCEKNDQVLRYTLNIDFKKAKVERSGIKIKGQVGNVSEIIPPSHRHGQGFFSHFH